MNFSQLASKSRFYQRLERRYESYLHLLESGDPQREGMLVTLKALQEQCLDIPSALRILRQLVMHRLIKLDCEQQAPLATVTRAVTDLAELALDVALQNAYQELDERYGQPFVLASATRAQMWVLGMGKLGARELNVSSDIDLIYVYDEDGETAGNSEGRNRISNHEYFCKAVKLVSELIGNTTEHGFVFRVDLALRPNGNSGPAAVSLSALEEYLQVQGREWERFAWLKSRVVAPTTDVQNGTANAMRAVVLPFVFRKYLDYNVFESLRSLHLKIRQESARRSAGRPERANDVKLSRGGIREIEFTVQLLQVVRGGQFPELRKRPTLKALQCVARAGLMSNATAQALSSAYEFLRRVEHRIQYLDDQQTHVLPTDDADLNWIASTMGYDSSGAFLIDLDAHREFVANEFDNLLRGAESQNTSKSTHCKSCSGQQQKHAHTHADQSSNNGTTPELTAFRNRINDWLNHPRVLGLRDESRLRLDRLLQRTQLWLQESRVTELAALRSIDFIEPLLRRESYLALLWERPFVHERLLKLLGSAKWSARYLLQHPGVIDELASQTWATERFNAADFERDLDLRIQSLQRTGEDDVETLLNLLRRAHHAELFRTLARDIEGQLSVEQVADDLSALADAVLRTTISWCWQRLKNKHRESPQIAVIGYGKLGGKELGYGSDLDIVFVYDDDDERSGEIYSGFVRKLITWLDTKTAEGDLFEIDTALRPNGGSGLLVTSMSAFADYQENRGSNTAWTWEHQAMTRARFVAGYEPLRQQFDTVRKNVISAKRDLMALKTEILAMRDRLKNAHAVKAGLFDVKHSAGGMLDAEFAVQYLVLAYSALHPSLQDNVGNIALLQRAESVGLLPAGVGEAAAQSYRQLRHVQHMARLDEATTQLPDTELQNERQAMTALWEFVFLFS
ncbi:MAG: bifunctional [glutamate--ammonia ligase]-adenylyl-L-tyrosine phosphorylase/[glutamate--ammonia-ligase] adenylyltransferase [Polaromonas sp.]|jgi:glutamate-ammonia-ligase adenylyltransferase|nr:bifunctional [glutamate--ammonia ligase]-adenylyl-L-tyrosine phosphorylase/[glutamate--ammonia-ligase] adenylyltransferase [Polaromonas sp.]MBP6088278.1 bifunctional [glutamate--ammonia ligase]-adenylyl-L-tyrosine phosphorylase/[glutamate--ammonia-ligase] adenylyltransferase [Polaromonas sp.]MBP6155609.1 bifunctional [glutamate--ammonia ligase]-adenylyl-L-tyrosine phosphorylase/[glutamate--ammonia-ligase] adenylyltransferase [Polaromonas sp.]MBP7115104.1 bifunctional [glutamate--ammonia ligas